MDNFLASERSKTHDGVFSITFQFIQHNCYDVLIKIDFWQKNWGQDMTDCQLSHSNTKYLIKSMLKEVVIIYFISQQCVTLFSINKGPIYIYNLSVIECEES